jgi:hypothetical protein
LATLGRAGSTGLVAVQRAIETYGGGAVTVTGFGDTGRPADANGTSYQFHYYYSLQLFRTGHNYHQEWEWLQKRAAEGAIRILGCRGPESVA